MFSETDRKLIGKRIKSARDFRGYTLNKVALLSNLSASTIQRYEAGSFERIKLPTLAAIADALCVSTSWLSLKTEDPGYYDSGSLLEIVASKNGLRNAEALLRYGKNVPTPAETGKRSITDDELMFALWGDSTDGITDSDLEEVRRFAGYIRDKKLKDQAALSPSTGKEKATK